MAQRMADPREGELLALAQAGDERAFALLALFCAPDITFRKHFRQSGRGGGRPRRTPPTP